MHVMRERAEHVDERGDLGRDAPKLTVQAVVLKINDRSLSARIRILGETEQVTFRSGDAFELFPGQIATLELSRRWTWRGDAYASGSVQSARIDVATLGLDPLPLEDLGPYDFDTHDPFEDPHPYAPLWRRLTARPRHAFEMHGIHWGAGALGGDEEDDFVCDAVDLANAGDVGAARALLMELLCEDLRCVDAHAHLGNLVFERAPAEAIVHYEIGVRIGELSLPAGFDGVLPWGCLYNRPMLRCLNGLALCQWRLGRSAEALATFERLLALNPPDNQAAWVCREDSLAGRSWEEAVREERLGPRPDGMLMN
jgi:hypothetical protein